MSIFTSCYIYQHLWEIHKVIDEILMLNALGEAFFLTSTSTFHYLFWLQSSWLYPPHSALFIRPGVTRDVMKSNGGGGEADQCGHSREVSAWWATLHVWKVRFPNLMLPKTIQAHLFALPEEKLWILNCRSCTWILYELQLSWATDRCHCFFWSSTGSQCWSFRQLQLGSECYVPYQSMFLVFWKWPVWTWWI